MERHFGPWSTALGSGLSHPLSAFWTERMGRLRDSGLHKARLTRRDWLRLGTAGAALGAIPTLRLASAEGRSGASEFGNALRNKIVVYAQMKEAPELPGQPPVPETSGVVRDRSGYRRLPEDRRARWPGSCIARRHQGRIREVRPTSPGQPAGRLGTWMADLGAGKEPVKLIDPTGNICWSPRGDRLIVSEWNDQPGESFRENTCWLVNADGSDLRKLTIPATDEVDDWSPDGDWLLTVSSRQPPGDPGYQLYVMRLDGSGERRISDGHGTNVYPRFSPDGKHVAYFHRVGDNGASRILIVDLDGNNRRTLFEERNLEAPDHVAWSPDGARLVVNTMTWKMGDDGNKYISDPYEAKMRLIVLNADGKGLREIPLPRICSRPAAVAVSIAKARTSDGSSIALAPPRSAKVEESVPRPERQTCPLQHTTFSRAGPRGRITAKGDLPCRFAITFGRRSKNAIPGTNCTACGRR